MRATLNQGLTQKQAIAFALPLLAVAFFVAPMGLLLGIYAKHYGLNLVSLGMVLLVTRLFDAVTDPLIGYFSDRNKRRTGTRKPFVVVGGLLMFPCVLLLVSPIAGMEGSVFYFSVCSMLFYLLHTVFFIPYMAWASELTQKSKERVFVFSAVSYSGQIGGLLFFCVPFLPIFSSTEITPEALEVAVWVGGVLIIPVLMIAVKHAPNGSSLAVAEKPYTQGEQGQSKIAVFKTYIHVFSSNKPFQFIGLSYLFSGLGLGTWGGLFFIYIDAFLGAGDIFAQLAVMGVIIGLVITPICFKLATLFGKRTIWMTSTVILFFGILYSGLLVPGDAALTNLLILKIILLSSAIVGGVITPAILSDSADYGKLSDPQDRGGMYFSVYALLIKINGALGAALGLIVAGWLGYDATAIDQATPDNMFAMRTAMAWLPMLFIAISIFFIWHMPLNERRCEIIQRRLGQRKHLI